MSEILYEFFSLLQEAPLKTLDLTAAFEADNFENSFLIPSEIVFKSLESLKITGDIVFPNLLTAMPTLRNPGLYCEEVAYLISLIPSTRLEKIKFDCKDWSLKHMREGLRRVPPLKRVEIAFNVEAEDHEEVLEVEDEEELHQVMYDIGLRLAGCAERDAGLLKDELGIEEIYIDSL
ncbi:hypothetical protein HDV00_000788 [Rhizophlyctis rosea]|nr:hypothetical protein HDV00_000788 [Rhizophlyctis rosea]